MNIPWGHSALHDTMGDISASHIPKSDHFVEQCFCYLLWWHGDITILGRNPELSIDNRATTYPAVSVNVNLIIYVIHIHLSVHCKWHGQWRFYAGYVRKIILLQ